MSHLDIDFADVVEADVADADVGAAAAAEEEIPVSNKLSAVKKFVNRRRVGVRK